MGVVKDQQLTLETLQIHKIAKAVIFQLRLSLTRQRRASFLKKKLRLRSFIKDEVVYASILF